MRTVPRSLAAQGGDLMKRYRLSGLLLLALFAGCFTAPDLTDARDEGRARVYAASAGEAIVRSVAVLGAYFPEVETDGSGYITATSVGEFQGVWSSAAVWVESLGPGLCRVTVTTRRWFPVQILTRMEDYQFHASLRLPRARGP